MKPKDDRVIRSYEQWQKHALSWADHDFKADPRRVINKPYIHPKTQKQNNTAHMLLSKIADEIGEGRELFKKQFKWEYGVIETVTDRSGVEHLETKSLEHYDREEMQRLIDMILFVASDHFNIVLEIKKYESE